MAPRTLYAAVATVSWIDPRSQLKKVDPNPPAAELSRGFLTTNADNFRFVNFLEAYVTISDADVITTGDFTPDSNIYRGPSALGLDSMAYPIQRDHTGGGASMTFRQMVGARTHTPEAVGEVAGSVLGAGAGYGGAALVLSYFSPAAPVTAVLTIGGLGVGYLTGKYSAKKIFNYPPIWSELHLTLRSTGSVDVSLQRHSLFPSLTFYHQATPPGPEIATRFNRTAIANGGGNYDGVPNLQRWQDHGWGGLQGGSAGPTAGNPWGANLSDFEHI